MLALIGASIAMGLIAYLVFHREPERLSRNELPRFRRMREETRRSEIHPFE